MRRRNAKGRDAGDRRPGATGSVQPARTTFKRWRGHMSISARAQELSDVLRYDNFQ
jgi:hypothetical protein